MSVARGVPFLDLAHAARNQPTGPVKTGHPTDAPTEPAWYTGVTEEKGGLVRGEKRWSRW